MMTPQGFEHYVRAHQEQLLKEAADERLAAAVRPRMPGIRRRLARSLYGLAAWLSAGVADARSAQDGIRAVATCCGVEYWRPAALPLRR
jgi:hypothetical protein